MAPIQRDYLSTVLPGAGVGMAMGVFLSIAIPSGSRMIWFEIVFCGLIRALSPVALPQRATVFHVILASSFGIALLGAALHIEAIQSSSLDSLAQLLGLLLAIVPPATLAREATLRARKARSVATRAETT